MPHVRGCSAVERTIGGGRSLVPPRGDVPGDRHPTSDTLVCSDPGMLLIRARTCSGRPLFSPAVDVPPAADGHDNDGFLHVRVDGLGPCLWPCALVPRIRMHASERFSRKRRSRSIAREDVPDTPRRPRMPSSLALRSHAGGAFPHGCARVTPSLGWHLSAPHAGMIRADASRLGRPMTFFPAHGGAPATTWHRALPLLCSLPRGCPRRAPGGREHRASSLPLAGMLPTRDARRKSSVALPRGWPSQPPRVGR